MTSQEQAMQFFTVLYGGDFSDNRKYMELVKNFLDSVSEPMEVLLDDPYRLVTDYHFPLYYFYQQGHFQFQIGTFEDYLTVFYASMYDILDSSEHGGDTWVDMHFFVSRMMKRFPHTEKTFIESCIVYFNQTKDPDHRFFYDGKRIGLLKNKKMETFIANRVGRLLREPSCSTSDFSYHPSAELCSEQNDAIRSVMRTDFSILTGGPGTGKTTTINFILEEYRQQYENKEIVLLAPTGKAAKRMDTCTHGQYHPTTIHYLALKEYYNHDNGNPDVIDFCVIDEGSMIPLDIFYCLMRFVRIRKLLIVGDVDQLPSVSCGDILHDLIDLRVPTARLFQNHRSGDAIVSNARKIRRGISSLSFNEHFRMLPADEEALFDTVLSEYDDPRHTMVLCPTRALTREMNQRIRQHLFPHAGNLRYSVGDRVLFVRNNRMEHYVNGDTGTVVESAVGDMVVRLDTGQRVYVHGKIFDDVELGYALTIHKSQGSEYERVLLCIPKGTGKIFSRNLLYTAVTRARTEVCLIGSEDDLKDTIRQEPRRRQTFLRSFSMAETPTF